MSDIQVDMFEVQLGAALFLQFVSGGERVTVLADAGIAASGYSVTHVRDQLLPILDMNGKRRIDLVIGTHYDEDHLNGLVPIIEDRSIEIGEAWMPPIANDTIPYAFGSVLTDDDLLPHQLSKDGGREILEHYLLRKRQDYELVKEIVETQGDFQTSWFASESEDRIPNIDADTEFFREEFKKLVPKGDCFHGDDQGVEEDVTGEFLSGNQMPESGHQRLVFWENLINNIGFVNYLRRTDASASKAINATLNNIRRSIAKDAINAAALNKIIVALRNRNIPIKTEMIEDGEPRKYYWQPTTRRFAFGTGSKLGLELALLGPSRGLVRRHWNKLPVKLAMSVALKFATEIKGITPSNQLSYIARFGFLNQGILVSGDAGCVDFKPPRRRGYYTGLLDTLLPLHIIQVAHHGGRNAHFYRVLESAGFFDQKESSFLLLSHSTDDRHRPSDEFRKFLMEALNAGDDAKVLFTSKPRTERVTDYLQNIHMRVGPGGNVGNVRLEFSKGTWDVKSHAIAI